MGRKPGVALPSADFDELSDYAYVRLPTVMRLFGMSRSSIWRNIGKVVPQPRRFTARVTAWNVGELRHALSVKKGGASR